MKLFREYAIIILDDDIGYADDTFESLFNAYIENPNIISGRRTHLMTQSNNGDYKGYFKWIFQQNFVKEANFSLILTNVGSKIFPPDILNINEKLLLIINETITRDDLTLKYLSNIKGIPTKLVVNNNFLGIKRILPKTNDKPLYRLIITILIGSKLSDSLIDEKRKKETNNKICLSKEEYNLFRKQQIIWKFIKIVSIG